MQLDQEKLLVPVAYDFKFIQVGGSRIRCSEIVGTCTEVSGNVTR